MGEQRDCERVIAHVSQALGRQNHLSSAIGLVSSHLLRQWLGGRVVGGWMDGWWETDVGGRRLLAADQTIGGDRLTMRSAPWLFRVERVCARREVVHAPVSKPDG